ncbi:hypothetical protein G5S_0699 [Chlamydia pecorum E58]|uniref:Uncharacterized protein n=1 Tax=Chlamydia pecorum (strain ATCC VR-628 / DSM 29919 / E58) TaxID=331635 RepID=A0AA34WI70_CHLPE|nr:hypothetical protein G5S_0699 [Chlamydia pecorum E58]
MNLLMMGDFQKKLSERFFLKNSFAFYQFLQ